MLDRKASSWTHGEVHESRYVIEQGIKARHLFGLRRRSFPSMQTQKGEGQSGKALLVVGNGTTTAALSEIRNPMSHAHVLQKRRQISVICAQAGFELRMEFRVESAILEESQLTDKHRPRASYEDSRCGEQHLPEVLQGCSKP